MKAIIILLCCAFAISVSAQEKAVPNDVKKTFKKEFKGAESPSWYVEETYYEVQFLQEKTEKLAHFSKETGALIEIKELITKEQIPNRVIDAVEVTYPDYILQEYFRSKLPDTPMEYSITVETSKGIYALRITSRGEITKTTVLERK